MKDFFKECGHTILIDIVKGPIELLVISVFSFWYGIYFEDNPLDPIVCVIAGIAICVLGIGIAVWQICRKYKKWKLSSAYTVIKNDYFCESVCLELAFQNREDITQIQTVHLFCGSKPLPHITHRMDWTGSDYESSFLDNTFYNGHTMRVCETRKVPPIRVSVEIDPVLKPSEDVLYTLNTKVKDTKRIMDSQLSKAVTRNTKELILRVSAQDNRLLRNVRFGKYVDVALEQNIGPEEPLKAQRVGLSYMYEKRITEPTVQCFYAIKWDFC